VIEMQKKVIELNAKDFVLLADALDSKKIDNYEVIEIVKNVIEFLKKNEVYDEAEYLSSLIGEKSVFEKQSEKINLPDLRYFVEVKRETVDANEVILNSDKIVKLISIISDKKLINKIGGLRIFLYGKPGTGKTTFVLNLSEMLGYKLLKINLKEIVSSKLGDSQKNLLSMFDEIKKIVDKKVILLFDEFDSLIGSRDKEMHNEYYRIIGTFNEILDSLKMFPVPVFAISNRIDFIDNATLRRFNLKIKLNNISLIDFENILFKKLEYFDLSYQSKVFKKLLYQMEDKLNFAMIDEIVNETIFQDKKPEEVLASMLGYSKKDINKLGLTLREAEIVFGESKSKLGRTKKNG
jgi:SpoVK/Ycf46/Vps4 family AAA+-type ATPase